MIGLDDKREVTAILAVSMNGEFLFQPFIYGGKTPRCHSVSIFPLGGTLHIPNLIGPPKTMPEYIDEVLVPYMTRQTDRGNS